MLAGPQGELPGTTSVRVLGSSPGSGNLMELCMHSPPEGIHHQNMKESTEYNLSTHVLVDTKCHLTPIMYVID